MELPRILGSLYGMEDTCFSVKEKVTGFESHNRAFLKIQDGCDQKCSYCKVNLVRGPSRSKEKREIIEELAALTLAGYREIVLTGICLGAWKGGSGEELSDLLGEIEKIGGDFRIRLSSIEPNCISSSLIDSISASKRICRHLHIPLQSGSDRILKLMNRRYDAAQFQEVVEEIRAKMPFVGITMDVISGFPGETDEDFQRTIDFIQRIRPSRMHVFGYSDRKGTPAFKMKDKVPSSEIKTRVNHLIGIGEKFQEDFCRKFIGKEVEVLVEERHAGYSGEYVKVKLGSSSAGEGSLIRVKAKEKEDNSPCLLVL
jgi:threonylcarbamoyladenosine tRNA methylthiotransferase MtaB